VLAANRSVALQLIDGGGNQLVLTTLVIELIVRIVGPGTLAAADVDYVDFQRPGRMRRQIDRGADAAASGSTDVQLGQPVRFVGNVVLIPGKRMADVVRATAAIDAYLKTHTSKQSSLRIPLYTRDGVAIEAAPSSSEQAPIAAGELVLALTSAKPVLVQTVPATTLPGLSTAVATTPAVVEAKVLGKQRQSRWSTRVIVAITVCVVAVMLVCVALVYSKAKGRYAFGHGSHMQHDFDIKQDGDFQNDDPMSPFRGGLVKTLQSFDEPSDTGPYGDAQAAAFALPKAGEMMWQTSPPRRGAKKGGSRPSALPFAVPAWDVGTAPQVGLNPPSRQLKPQIKTYGFSDPSDETDAVIAEVQEAPLFVQVRQRDESPAPVCSPTLLLRSSDRRNTFDTHDELAVSEPEEVFLLRKDQHEQKVRKQLVAAARQNSMLAVAVGPGPPSSADRHPGNAAPAGGGPTTQPRSWPVAVRDAIGRQRSVLNPALPPHSPSSRRKSVLNARLSAQKRRTAAAAASSALEAERSEPPTVVSRRASYIGAVPSAAITNPAAAVAAAATATDATAATAVPHAASVPVEAQLARRREAARAALTLFRASTGANTAVLDEAYDHSRAAEAAAVVRDATGTVRAHTVLKMMLSNRHSDETDRPDTISEQDEYVFAPAAATTASSTALPTSVGELTNARGVNAGVSGGLPDSDLDDMLILLADAAAATVPTPTPQDQPPPALQPAKRASYLHATRHLNESNPPPSPQRSLGALHGELAGAAAQRPVGVVRSPARSKQPRGVPSAVSEV
jgi:hypothetical protein